MEQSFDFLSFINYKLINNWDFKSFSKKMLKSNYDIVSLKSLLIEQNKKNKIFEYPDEDFKILGVSNQIGLFDAYIEKGQNINQPYKKVENGYFAYNPYRINVGSIGLKSGKQKYNYISPAYVVFSCKDILLPEYLEILLKTDYFKECIKNNTTGSVRQTLSFKNLCNIEVPLPSLEEQKEIVSSINNLIQQANNIFKEADKLEKSIDDYLIKELGIDPENLKINKNKAFQVVEYKNMQKWDTRILSNNNDLLFSKFYKTYKLSDILNVNPKTEYPHTNETEISFIPMENVSDVYGEVLIYNTKLVSQSKGYTKFKNNDLIWAKITPCMQNGKSAIVENLLNEYGCGSTEFHIIRNDKKANLINIYFIYNIFRMDIVLSHAMKSFTGACGQQRVPADFLKNIKVPIPPLEVQNKIVIEIDKIKEKIKSLRMDAKILEESAVANFENRVFG